MYASEKEAIDAFSVRSASQDGINLGSGEKVVCVDPSLDLLAYLNVLLKRSGYDVFTTHSLQDARTFVKVMKPKVVVCGPGLQANDFAMENLRQAAGHSQLVLLSANFSTTEASHAGLDLVERLRAILNSPQA
jgi:DNA-binding response OmpR family regulator